MMKQVWLSRSETSILKGIAIVFMFVHHMFTIPGWYVSTVSSSFLFSNYSLFQQPFKMCVSIFAFLTGYLYWYSSNHHLNYSFQKTIRFLISYWLVTILLIGIALGLHAYVWNLKNVFLELLGMREDVMIFCWYVYFYLLIMCVLPLVHRLFKEASLRICLMGVLLPVLFILGLMTPFTFESSLYQCLDHIRVWLPVTMMGWICAKFSFFEWMDDHLHPSKIISILLWVGMALLSFFGRKFLPGITLLPLQLPSTVMASQLNFDIFYTPLFIYSVIKLIRLSPYQMKGLSFLGNHSMYMWFLHCVFFNCTKTIFQPILYFPGFRIGILIWGILLTLLPSILLVRIEKFLFR